MLPAFSIALGNTMSRSKLKEKTREIPLIRLSLKLREGNIVVDKVIRLSGLHPGCEVDIHTDVPTAIIGHWVDIYDIKGKIIYRRFVQNNLPMNMEYTESKVQHIYAPNKKYHVMVPDLAEGHLLVLYEQSLSRPETKIPLKRTRLTLGLVYAQGKCAS